MHIPFKGVVSFAVSLGRIRMAIGCILRFENCPEDMEDWLWDSARRVLTPRIGLGGNEMLGEE